MIELHPKMIELHPKMILGKELQAQYEALSIQGDTTGCAEGAAPQNDFWSIRTLCLFFRYQPGKLCRFNPVPFHPLGLGFCCQLYKGFRKITFQADL